MQFDGQTTGIRMYNFALEADTIWNLYHGKMIWVDWVKNSCTASRAGEVYLIVNANMYSPGFCKLDYLSATLLSLLSAVNRKVFDRIWPPKPQENK